MTERIKTSGPVFRDEYEDAVERLLEYALGKRPSLQLREVEAEEELLDLIGKFQATTQLICTAVRQHSLNEETLRGTYDRVADEIHKKYNHPVIALYYSAVGDAGIVSIEHAVHLRNSQDVLTKLLAEDFEKEYPDRYNPYKAVAEMYALGVWPKGFKIVEEQERFVVDVPIILRSTRGRDLIMAACWAQGDEQIRWAHSMIDDCTYNLDLTVPPDQSQPRKIEPKDGYFVIEPSEG